MKSFNKIIKIIFFYKHLKFYSKEKENKGKQIIIFINIMKLSLNYKIYIYAALKALVKILKFKKALVKLRIVFAKCFINQKQ